MPYQNVIKHNLMTFLFKKMLIMIYYDSITITSTENIYQSLGNVNKILFLLFNVIIFGHL